MFDKFINLVGDQFLYGGQKYALAGEEARESTDVLFDKHGFRWLIGTIDKYCFRWKNCAREKDLLKIATYQYILWLKRGFFVMKNGINDPAIDTNLKNKQDNFQLFINKIKEDEPFYSNWNITWSELQNRNPDRLYNIDANISNILVKSDNELINEISTILTKFSKEEWKEIEEDNLIHIFWLSYFLWERNFKDKAGEDTDTWNKGDKNMGKTIIDQKTADLLVSIIDGKEITVTDKEVIIESNKKKRGRPKGSKNKVKTEEVK